MTLVTIDRTREHTPVPYDTTDGCSRVFRHRPVTILSWCEECQCETDHGTQHTAAPNIIVERERDTFYTDYIHGDNPLYSIVTLLIEAK